MKPSKFSKKDYEAAAVVKFQGSSENRITLDTPILDLIKREGCHQVVCYPPSKRPVNIQNDDVIFISQLTRNPESDPKNDIHIYGCAVGMAYREGQDEATAADIKRRPWKKNYPFCIQLNEARFVRGTVANGVSLNELMAKLGADSFATTQFHMVVGEGNTDPRKSVQRQAAIRLSQNGFKMLKKWLEAAFNTHGTIPRSMIDKIV